MATSVEDGGFFTVEQLRKKRNIAKATYYEWVRKGKAPKPCKGIPHRVGLAWLEECAAQARAVAAAASAAVEDLDSEGANK